MGRLSRYKKVKSVDPFAKNGSSWKSDIGDCTTLHRVKRKSKTAIKMKEQKMSKFQRRARGKKGDDASTARSKKSGGSNGWGDDDGYDLPPDGGDDFEMNDLMGSLKKQSYKSNPLLDTNNSVAQSVHLSSGSGEEKEKWTRKIQKVNVRDVAVASGGDKVDINAQSSKKQVNKSKDNKGDAKQGGASTITAKSSIRDIIESCSNPKPIQQSANYNASSSTTDMSKQEKRKAFFEKKKLKKRKRGKSSLDDDDSDDYDTHHQEYSSGTVASRRPALDDQVERPPTFTMLPRGANKLAKNSKTNNANKHQNSSAFEDEESAALRIRKEQQALEAMREKVMKQYAILRESRRTGR